MVVEDFRLKNEHVARVSDVGTLDSGEPFMVMEYLDGEDLADLLRKRGETIPVMLDIFGMRARQH